MTARALLRFLRSFDATSDDACWIWTAKLDRKGYGEFFFIDRWWRAHRFAYTFYVATITDELTIDHLCRTKACVNPRHLEPVTALENSLRFHALRTHCAQGHEFTSENTYWRVDRPGTRECRECGRQAQRRRQARIRSAA